MVIEKIFYDKGFSYRKKGNRIDFYKADKKIAELIFFDDNVMYINDITYQEGRYVKRISVNEKDEIVIIFG